MRIAFTHNLQTTDSPEQAEYDSPATVESICAALERVGHVVCPIDVSQPLSDTLCALERFQPGLVFNTAEGRRGRYREAFFPGLFEELGLIYTASGPYACTLTLDKHQTKLNAAWNGVPTPRAVLLGCMADLESLPALRYPLIVKPNAEGSSLGITQQSIAETPEALRELAAAALVCFPEGVLVEEFILGRDIVVPFLELGSPETGGVLDPVEYVIADSAANGRKYAIYDFELKHSLEAAVDVRAPARLPGDTAEELLRLSRILYRTLDIRDLGRIDFRLSPDGEIYFLEVNALPSLEPGAGIYASAALAGFSTVESVLNIVVESALRRRVTA